MSQPKVQKSNRIIINDEYEDIEDQIINNQNHDPTNKLNNDEMDPIDQINDKISNDDKNEAVIENDRSFHSNVKSQNKESNNIFITNNIKNDGQGKSSNDISVSHAPVDVSVTNINSSDMNLNQTINDDDIIFKINEEAKNFEKNNIISGNDIYDKYNKVTEQQFKEMIKDKNKQILLLSEQQEVFKKELTKIIDQLNDAFDKSTESYPKKLDQNPLHNKYLEQQITVKEKELQNIKSQMRLYKKQYNIVNAKANEKFTTDKITEMEEQIVKIKKENLDNNMKLKKLRNIQYTQGKELETNNLIKKFPNQINAYTEEIKNLMNKKHEYYMKLTNHKKSLTNLRNILNSISKNLDKTVNGKNFQRNVDNISLMQSIEDSLNNIKMDLNLPEEELIEKINNFETFNKYSYINSSNSNSKFLNAPRIAKSRTIIQDKIQALVHNISPHNKIFKNSANNNNFESSTNRYINSINKNNNLLEEKINIRKKSPDLTLPKILPAINNRMKIERSQSSYRGIFIKYEYLNQKEKSNPHNSDIKNKHQKALSSLQKKLNFSKKNKTYNDSNNTKVSDEKNLDFNDENKNNLSDEIINLNLDYEHTHNIDYLNLQKKENQLINIYNKLEKNIKEIEKLYEKKFKDIQNTIEHNQKKLKILQQQNELLAIEIADLTKIFKLNVEEVKLKREIKDNESKILKSVILNTNDVSQTRNDILNDLNTILKEEANTKTKKEIKENVIKEEHGESNNSIMNHDMDDHKQIKFPDISNVEHIDDETINPNRLNKLANIKNKYLNENENYDIQIQDNELENYNHNLNLNDIDNVVDEAGNLILETENINN